MRGLLVLIISIMTLSLAACAPAFQVTQSSMLNSGNKDSGIPDEPNDDVDPTTPPPTSTIPTDTTSDEVLKICSRLDFVGVQWPSTLMTAERRAMALALNITGSFEGANGWQNLTNNFDGQGMSLGLNQQNFGQGSLQPLLVAVNKSNPTLMKTLFSTTNLSKLNTMLSDWKTSASEAFVSAQAAGAYDGAMDGELNLFPNKEALTELDEDFAQVSVLDARTNGDVAWAKANLYLSNGTTFKTDWKNSFLALSVAAPYRTLQVQAALTMYAKAVGYYESFKFKELRSLLMMYDIVVQNGGFTASHLSQFKTYNAANPNASETARLTKLLSIRLTSVRSQYRADVLSRKTAIINGTGRVHGSTRNLQKEYCYSSTEVLRTN